jgi:hypothetical protein
MAGDAPTSATAMAWSNVVFPVALAPRITFQPA